MLSWRKPSNSFFKIPSFTVSPEVECVCVFAHVLQVDSFHIMGLHHWVSVEVFLLIFTYLFFGGLKLHPVVEADVIS